MAKGSSKKQKNRRADAEGVDAEDDAADFEREWAEANAEIERAQAKSRPILVGIFLLVAVISLGVAAVSGALAARRVLAEQSAPGRVVDLEVRISEDFETGEPRRSAHPVVAFSPAGQPEQQVEIAEGSWPPAYDVGDAVAVRYNPADPSTARIDSSASTLLAWLLPAITGVLGTVFLVVGLLVARFTRPARGLDRAARAGAQK